MRASPPAATTGGSPWSKGRSRATSSTPRTGKGANKLVSDTIIAPDATTADALSTAVNVLGLEKGLALIERLPSTEAILIPAEQGASLVYSSGVKAYIAPTPEMPGPHGE